MPQFVGVENSPLKECNHVQGSALSHPQMQDLSSNFFSNQHEFLDKLLLGLIFGIFLDLTDHLVPIVIENLHLGFSVNQLVPDLLLDKTNVAVKLPNANSDILNLVVLH